MGMNQAGISNPFFPSIVLAVGSWNFTIWNLTESSIENGSANKPILESPLQKVRYTSAVWSSTRPSTFFLGKANGNLEVWDVLERTNEPALKQVISSAAITDIKPKIISPRQHLIAVSDAAGTINILTLPYILRTSNNDIDQSAVNSYTGSESERIVCFLQRLENRESSGNSSKEDDKQAENKPSEEEEKEIKTKFYEKFSKFESQVQASLA